MAKTQSERGAIDLLSQDHKRIHKLFKDFEKAERDDPDAVRELVETACLELQIHSMLEEEIFYPAIRAQSTHEQHEDMLNRSEVEHESIDELIAKLHALQPDDPMYYAYFSVLADHVRHHIRQEEQTLFPAAQNMSGLDMNQLGESMRSRREELFAEMEQGDEEEADGSDLEASDLGDDTGVESEEELEDEQEQIDISRTRH
jgi:hemerythrin-like domain-containing protein